MTPSDHEPDACGGSLFYAAGVHADRIGRLDARQRHAPQLKFRWVRNVRGGGYGRKPLAAGHRPCSLISTFR